MHENRKKKLDITDNLERRKKKLQHYCRTGPAVAAGCQVDRPD